MIPGEELASLGNIKGSPSVFGFKFDMHTLDSDEEDGASLVAASFDKETGKQIIKKEKLARAITTINGVPFSVSQEEKDQKITELQKARKLIYKWQSPVVNRVYEELLKLEAQRDEAVAALEKNAPTPTTPTGSGR